MRTAGPVDREYVLFNKHIIIFSELHHFFLKHSQWGKPPPPAKTACTCLKQITLSEWGAFYPTHGHLDILWTFLDIFHTWFIIYVTVTKTMITFLNTFNFCFTENKRQSLKGVFPPLYPINRNVSNTSTMNHYNLKRKKISNFLQLGFSVHRWRARWSSFDAKPVYSRIQEYQVCNTFLTPRR